MNPTQQLLQMAPQMQDPQQLMVALMQNPQLVQMLMQLQPLLAGAQAPVQQGPQTLGSTLTPATPGYAPKITQTRGEAETGGNLGQLLGGY
jgi:hypothetical protein